jgi:hypothetical protein
MPTVPLVEAQSAIVSSTAGSVGSTGLTFMDAVPGGYVNDEVAAAKYLRELRPVQNRRLDKHRSLFQIPRRANIQNDRRVALAEQHGHEGLAEISLPSGQKHLHITFSRVTRIE